MSDFIKNKAIVDEILELIDENKLTDIQKQDIYEIINSLTKISSLHKERFFKYYSFGKYKKNIYSIEDIAKQYKVSNDSIKNSITKIRTSMYYISKADNEKLDKLLNQYYKGNNLPRVKFIFDERTDIVYNLLELLRNNCFNDIQKQKICNILNNIQEKTQIQLERFELFYNLQQDNKTYKLCDLAKKYNCSSGAIRTSIGHIRARLIRIKDVDMYVLKSILNDYYKNQKF